MPRHIPVELYALIVQHITSKAELLNLCMVSRALRHEAQRILFHTVRLPNDYDRLASWCETIVGNPRLAMEVYALFLPKTFRHRPLSKAELNPMLERLQQAVNRALSSVSRLVELHTSSPVGTVYLNANLLCGHPFHLQVFEEDLPQCFLGHWLKFLSEQPGIRHWRTDIFQSCALDSVVLPLLTSAHVNATALDILTHCPMIRALRVIRWSSGYSDTLPGLEPFRYTLASLSLEYLGDLAFELSMVRDAVPNITFLGFQPQYKSQIFRLSADFLPVLSGFAHLTTLVFELPHGTQSPIGWPTNSGEVLSLAACFMNANPTLKRVAFEIKSSRTNGKWPCCIRAQTGTDSHSNGTAVFEAFDVLGPDSWRDV